MSVVEVFMALSGEVVPLPPDAHHVYSPYHGELHFRTHVPMPLSLQPRQRESPPRTHTLTHTLTQNSLLRILICATFGRLKQHAPFFQSCF